MAALVLECNCDMPWFAYLDFLQEAGWEVSELRCISGEEFYPSGSWSLYRRRDITSQIEPPYPHGIFKDIGFGDGYLHSNIGTYSDISNHHSGYTYGYAFYPET